MHITRGMIMGKGKGKLLTIEQSNYRQLAKMANQRAVRLERYLETHESAPKGGLQLYNYYLNYAYGDTRKRFPENPEKLSSEQLQEYTVMLSNFVNSELSKAGTVKKYEQQYTDYVNRKKAEREGIYMPDQADVKQLEQVLNDTKNKARAKGAETKVLGGKKILTPNEFFNQLGLMYKSKIMRVMDYKSAMKILSNVQNVPAEEVKRLIDKTAEDLANEKKLNYRAIKQRFDRLAKKTESKGKTKL